MTAPLDYATPPPRPAKTKRDWALIIAWIVMPILFAMIGLLIASLLRPTYSYTASGMLRVQANAVASAESISVAQQAEVALLKSPTFVAAIAAKTGIPSAVIATNLDVTALPGSQMLRVGYKSSSAQEAFSVATAITAEYSLQGSKTSAQVTVFSYPRMPRSVQTNAIPIAGCFYGAIIGAFLGLVWLVRKRRAERNKPWFIGDAKESY